MKREEGFSLIETLVSMAIFSLMSAAVYSTYMSQVKHTAREYQLARSEMDINIAKGIMERDLMMAGLGLATDFSVLLNAATLNLVAETRAIAATNAIASDGLVLMGTALGIEALAPQGWTASEGAALPLKVWVDEPRDNPQNGDRMVVLDPDMKRVLNAVPYSYGLGISGLPQGALAYGLAGATAILGATDLPHYWVRYALYAPSEPDIYCAAGTFSLGRAETRKRDNVPPIPAAPPSPSGSWGWPASGARPMLPCVLNMQVSFGLDTDEDNDVDVWDEGGMAAAGLSAVALNDQIKQIRVYLLVQASDRDINYSHPLSVLVGDSDLGTGITVALDQAKQQEQYRWELLTSVVTPRNIR